MGRLEVVRLACCSSFDRLRMAKRYASGWRSVTPQDGEVELNDFKNYYLRRRIRDAKTVVTPASEIAGEHFFFISLWDGSESSSE